MSGVRSKILDKIFFWFNCCQHLTQQSAEFYLTRKNRNLDLNPIDSHIETLLEIFRKFVGKEILSCD